MKAVKITVQVLIVLIIIFLLAAVITGGMILFGGFGSNDNFTYLLVLGTTVDGSSPSPMLNDRIQAAAKYMQSHPRVICVATGYQAEDADISEARCIYNGLTQLGIEPERILLEEQATSTGENFQFSLELLEQELGQAPKNIGVVSSEFHLMRAKMYGKHYELNLSTIPASTTDTESFFRYFVREIFVVWYDSLRLALS